MTGLALGLVVVAAALHASWNVLAKGGGDKLGFIWWTGVAGSVVLAPVVMLSAPWPAWELEGWIRIALGAALRAAYFLTLSAAYQRGDVSAVYPLARGSSPVIVAIAASVLLAARPASQAVAGIAAVAAGVYTMHLPWVGVAAVRQPFVALQRGAIGYAVLTGGLTAAYSVVDKANMTAGLDPVWYAYLTIPVTALLLAPAAVRRPGWRREWRRRRWPILGVALLMPASYLLVLHALQVAAVSYVAPVREVGIIFAAVLGILVLGERHGGRRLAGAALILLGVVLITTAPPA